MRICYPLACSWYCGHFPKGINWWWLWCWHLSWIIVTGARRNLTFTNRSSTWLWWWGVLTSLVAWVASTLTILLLSWYSSNHLNYLATAALCSLIFYLHMNVSIEKWNQMQMDVSIVFIFISFWLVWQKNAKCFWIDIALIQFSSSTVTGWFERQIIYEVT